MASVLTRVREWMYGNVHPAHLPFNQTNSSIISLIVPLLLMSAELPSYPKDASENRDSFPNRNKKGRTPKGLIEIRRELVQDTYFMRGWSIRQILTSKKWIDASKEYEGKGFTKDGILNDIHAIEREIQRRAAREGDFIHRFNTKRLQAVDRCRLRLTRLNSMRDNLAKETGDIQKADPKMILSVEHELGIVEEQLTRLELLEDPKDIMVRKIMEMMEHEQTDKLLA